MLVVLVVLLDWDVDGSSLSTLVSIDSVVSSASVTFALFSGFGIVFVLC